MIVKNKICFEESTILLEEGIDYNKSDLVVDAFTRVGRCLSADHLTEIAKKNDFDSWSWTDTIYPDEQGQYPAELKVKFRKGM